MSRFVLFDNEDGLPQYLNMDLVVEVRINSDIMADDSSRWYVKAILLDTSSYGDNEREIECSSKEEAIKLARRLMCLDEHDKPLAKEGSL